MSKERLQKILAAAGIDSRRNCEQLILEGQVRVNGKVVNTLPVFADIDNDVITVAGRKINRPGKIYYLLNKPKGVICSTADRSGRKKVIDFIDCSQRIFCAGMLDIEASGLVILTSDSILADRLTHPRYSLEKIYVINLKGRITPDLLDKMKKGVWLSEGKAACAGLKVLKESNKESLLEIKISQNINRQIHRMMAKLGIKVISLKRIKIGKIALGHLKPAGSRKLTSAEINYLKKEAGLEN